ncbi:MAG: hypothetical protein GY710_18945 [Desulfobacteraceae bacterium]|nr:hypothetical protein [Desulfobacteraceae bacterium]
MKAVFILFTVIFLTSCASYKGTIRPNWGIADFDKYGDAYYLSTEQIKIGDTKEIVIEEYGNRFKSNTNDNGSEIWSFKSYKATPFTDPVEKIVIVEFTNDLVIDVSEKYIIGQNSVTSTEKRLDEKLRRLKKLLDDGIISKQEFETKKAEILKKM